MTSENGIANDAAPELIVCTLEGWLMLINIYVAIHISYNQICYISSLSFNLPCLVSAYSTYTRYMQKLKEVGIIRKQVCNYVLASHAPWPVRNG